MKEISHRCRVLHTTKKEGAALELAEVLTAASFETTDLPSARRRLRVHVNPNKIFEIHWPLRSLTGIMRIVI